MKAVSTLREAVQGVLSESSSGKSPKGFIGDIERLTLSNRDFRRVLYTAKHLQLVVMELPVGEHIGAEKHRVDQFFRVESGDGLAIVGDVEQEIKNGDAVIVPAGADHDIINIGETPLKLYTLYAPPHHRDGTVHETRADAEEDAERFRDATPP